MRCCLCPNEESLLIQVQAGSGLSLMLCPACEETPIFEVAARLAVENEKMRCCGNCKHERASTYNPDYGCDGCLEGYTKWGLAT